MSIEEPASEADVVKLTLKDLNLRAGMALQVRRLVEGASKTEAQLYGVVEGKGIMVGPLGPQGEHTGLASDEVCIARGFTGQHEFSFVSKVLQTFEQPFVYALLAYPTKVDARQVRQSMRTRTSWPVTAEASGLTAEGELVDISMQGAMINVPAAIAATGAPLKLTIRAVFEGAVTHLQLSAVVCHSHKPPGNQGHFIGMAFTELSQEDKLMLHFLTKVPHGS